MAARPFFKILYGQKIIIAGFPIYPVIRGNHGVRIEGGDNVIYHNLLSQSQLPGMHPINVQPNSWIIHILWNIGFAHSGRRLI